MMRVTFSDNNEERIITSDCSRSRSTQQTLRRHSDMWWLVIMTLICLIAQPLLVSGQYGEWYTACKSFNDVTRKFFAGGCLYVLVVAYHDGQWDEDGNQMGLAFDPSKMRGFLERNWKLMEIPCRYYKTLCNPPDDPQITIYRSRTVADKNRWPRSVLWWSQQKVYFVGMNLNMC